MIVLHCNNPSIKLPNPTDLGFAPLILDFNIFKRHLSRRIDTLDDLLPWDPYVLRVFDDSTVQKKQSKTKTTKNNNKAKVAI